MNTSTPYAKQSVPSLLERLAWAFERFGDSQADRFDTRVERLEAEVERLTASQRTPAKR